MKRCEAVNRRRKAHAQRVRASGATLYGLPLFFSAGHPRLVLSVMSLLLVTLGIALGFLGGAHVHRLPRRADSVPTRTVFHSKRAPLKQCPSNLPLRASPPANANPWAPLLSAEIQAIKAWLFSPSQSLNLTEGRDATDSDNIAFLIELYPPKKNEALAFLDNKSSRPPRYARATVNHGGLETPVTRDYLVGPLPISQQTTIRHLTDIYHREEIPFNARGLPDVIAFFGGLGRTLIPMEDIIQDLFNGTVQGDLLADTFTAGPSGGWGPDGSFRRYWISWKVNGPGSWVLPINFYTYVDSSGTDSSQWKILKVVYHNQTFQSAQSFIDAYQNGTLVRFPLPSFDNTWATRKRIGSPRDLDHLPGPRSVSFAGLRFRVDREQGYVSWLGWGMYLSFDRDMGLSLWDIRFRGERIAYEIKPQECLVQYAGFDPVQGITSWMDRFFGMGLFTRDLLPNYDCPAEAVFLPATIYHPVLGAITRKKAICVFEIDTGKPLTRHYGDWPGETGAVKGYVLTVRTIATLGNYDYLFDYIFHLDGTIEVKVSASGYLQGGYWTPEQSEYGSRIHTNHMGSVHDHVINFKVDLDIAGLSNTFRKTKTIVEPVAMPWLDEDDWHTDGPGGQVLQQKLEFTYVGKEGDDSRVRYPANFEEAYAIVNRDAKNAWGMERGYTVHPGLSPVHNIITKSNRLLKNANWASHNLAVSLRKDSEPSSSSMWNLHLPRDPPVDFDRFFDGEDISQKDLVLWINVGTHHKPTSEDAPTTKTNLAASSFYLAPVNYFDSDIAMESLNAIVIDPTGGTPPFDIDDYGVPQDYNCISQDPTAFSYDPQVG